MKKSVLIIKLGYAKTLVNEDGFTPSLGDVFRHTVLLHHYSNDRVPEAEVPGMMGIHFNTVKRWMKSGRLKYKTIPGRTTFKCLILKSSIDAAFFATCILCGKTFKSRYAEKAKLCCTQHKTDWFNWAKLGKMKHCGLTCPP